MKPLSDKQLPEGSSMFHSLLEDAAEGIFVLVNSKTIYANRALQEISGYSKDELLEMNIFDLLHPSERNFVLENYRKRVSGEAYQNEYRCRAVRKNGTLGRVRIRVISTTWEGQSAALSILDDETELSNSQSDGDDTYTRLALAAEGAQDGFWDVKFTPGNPLDPESTMWFSPQFLRLLGYREDDFSQVPQKLGTWFGFIHPEDRDGILGIVQESLKSQGSYNVEYRMKTRSGKYRWFHAIGRGIWGKDGTPIRASGSIRDIHDRKTAEQHLKESEERFRVLHEISFGGIGLHDRGKIIECNKGLCDVTGFSYDELIGMNGLLLIAPEYRDQVMEKIVNGYDRAYSVFGLKKNGSKYPLEIQGKNVRYYGKTVRVTEFRDISERYRMEDELRKMQRLESIGVLAGGIAHDFNNILTAILGNISLAKLKKPGEEGYETFLAEAENAAYRAKGLTAQFLTFSKGGTPVKGEASIREIITDSANFILAGSSISCSFHFAENLRQARVDRDQVSQVIQNLILNAKEAMPDGGDISISAKTVKINTDQQLPIRPGDYLQVSIEDTGIGISNEHIDNIFDPYFTTRDEGHGLGLSVVYSVIKRHGGFIKAESEPGRGSLFTFYIPAADISDRQVRLEREKPVSGMGRVLIMDDDRALRDVAKRMLESLGYRVKTSANGSDALDEFNQAIKDNKKFQLVILDLTIPGGKGGKEIIDDIKRLDPAVRAIVSSGYSDVAVMSEFKDYGFDGVMVKPYRIDEMSNVIHQVLSAEKS